MACGPPCASLLVLAALLVVSETAAARDVGAHRLLRASGALAHAHEGRAHGALTLHGKNFLTADWGNEYGQADSAIYKSFKPNNPDDYGRVLGKDYDFQLAPRGIHGSRWRTQDEAREFLSSEGSPPLLGFAKEDDSSTMWSIIQTSGGAFFLTTRSLLKTHGHNTEYSPLYVLDLDEQAQPVFAAYTVTQSRAGQAEWTMRENGEGSIFLRHKRTGLYLATKLSESLIQGAKHMRPAGMTSSPVENQASMLDLYPPLVAEKLADAGILNNKPVGEEAAKPKNNSYPWWLLLIILLLLLCCCCGSTSAAAAVFVASSSKTEQDLRRGIDKRDLSLLQKAIPKAKDERAEYDSKVEDWAAKQPAGTGASIPLDFKIEGLDYNKMTPEQQQAIAAIVRKLISEAAHVAPAAVGDINLSSGSVQVDTTLTMPAGRETAAAVAAPKQLLDAIATQTKLISGIDAAVVGSICVTSFRGPFASDSGKNSKPTDPVPSLEEAEAMVPILEQEQQDLQAARDLQKKADLLAKELMEAIREAMKKRNLERLSTALENARGKPGVDKSLLEEGFRFLAELERTARRMAAMAALQAACSKPSIVSLRSALDQARKAPLTSAEMREALDMLKALEAKLEAKDQDPGEMSLAHTAVKQKDPELLEKALQQNESKMPAEEVTQMREQLRKIKFEEKTQETVRVKLKNQLMGFKSDESVTATQVAATLDEARSVGISKGELDEMLQQWDPNGELHKVVIIKETRVIHIRIKKSTRQQVALESGDHPDQKEFVRALMPIPQDYDRKVQYDEHLKKYFAQLPVGNKLHYGPERESQAAAEADLKALCAAVDMVEEPQKVNALRKAQLQLHMSDRRSSVMLPPAPSAAPAQPPGPEILKPTPAAAPAVPPASVVEPPSPPPAPSAQPQDQSTGAPARATASSRLAASFGQRTPVPSSEPTSPPARPKSGQSPGRGAGQGMAKSGQSPGRGAGQGMAKSGQSPGRGAGQGMAKSGQSPGRGAGQGRVLAKSGQSPGPARAKAGSSPAPGSKAGVPAKAGVPVKGLDDPAGAASAADAAAPDSSSVERREMTAHGVTTVVIEKKKHHKKDKSSSSSSSSSDGKKKKKEKKHKHHGHD